MSDNEETREQVKTRLLKQYKAFRNFSMKIAMMLGSISFGVHFCIIVATKDPATLQIEKAFMQSGVSALAFGLLGYCIGSLMGSMMHRKFYKKLAHIKQQRNNSLQEQISIRQSRLEGMQTDLTTVIK